MTHVDTDEYAAIGRELGIFVRRMLKMQNKRNDTARLELKRYDPLLRRHVVFRETR